MRPSSAVSFVPMAMSAARSNQPQQALTQQALSRRAAIFGGSTGLLAGVAAASAGDLLSLDLVTSEQREFEEREYDMSTKMGREKKRKADEAKQRAAERAKKGRSELSGTPFNPNKRLGDQFGDVM